MKTDFYPPKKLNVSEFDVNIKSQKGDSESLFLESEFDFKKFRSTVLEILNSEHRFGIDVKDSENIEISAESKDENQLIFRAALVSIFVAFANAVYNQFNPEEE